MPSIHVIKSSAANMPKDKLSQPKETFSVFNDGDSDDLLEDVKREKKTKRSNLNHATDASTSSATRTAAFEIATKRN
ncbi:hypothetical protein BFW01_g3080 [Lasiodiplodia theobromae]|uniref:Uncharacterized protein n=2 Tax=Lasiodiplodia TaxID=66739 RepID=A0A5N5DVG4_9PEZI|nr:uncharacterized protein LTHEOB_4118 [Lasiodiplodia theobromae]KAB2580154.1 hypothetical protein DBV05_g1130 [Lasiodiplodia theobromae]KAF4546810.1 hypothetical protein LTHEOB_4118 [Lasiodiplodia theobromae]KAF9632218.1 hypothetical protein BFW01_g3080 [Lasiodiplodia theobromae]KAK0663721.1 hypothetical protein DIS24_g1155 [Lasiodiplodia hormozganensis]